MGKRPYTNWKAKRVDPLTRLKVQVSDDLYRDLQNSTMEQIINKRVTETELVTTDTVISACILALYEGEGFGQERCQRVAKATLDKIISCIDRETLLSDALDHIGLLIDVRDPIEPVSIKAKAKPRREWR